MKNEKGLGDPTAYLAWLARYRRVAADMRALNAELLAFEGKVASRPHRGVVSRFRRRLIRARRDYAKAEEVLGELYGLEAAIGGESGVPVP